MKVFQFSFCFKHLDFLSSKTENVLKFLITRKAVLASHFTRGEKPESENIIWQETYHALPFRFSLHLLHVCATSQSRDHWYQFDQLYLKEIIWCFCLERNVCFGLNFSNSFEAEISIKQQNTAAWALHPLSHTFLTTSVFSMTVCLNDFSPFSPEHPVY